MKTDVILILNVLAMFILSFSTDYWIYRSYDFRGLVHNLIRNQQQLFNIPATTNTNITNTNIITARFASATHPNGSNNRSRSHQHHRNNGENEDDHGGLTIISSEALLKTLENDVPYNFMQIIFPQSNSTALLFTEYGNLYRECNDLLDGYRRELSVRGYLYPTPCYNFISDDPFHRFRQTFRIKVAEGVSFSLALISGVILIFCVGLGTYASIQRNLRATLLTSASLLLMGLIYLMSIAVFLVKVQMMEEEIRNGNGSSEWGPEQNHPFISPYAVTRVGWSLGGGILSLILSGVSSYLYYSSGKSMKERRKLINRRHKLQLALMNSCKQDVAIAVQRKMILKNNTAA